MNDNDKTNTASSASSASSQARSSDGAGFMVTTSQLSAGAALPFYGVDSLYLFPNYHTRDEYLLLTGTPPPPFDPSLRPKHWLDPKARLMAGRAKMFYPRVMAISPIDGTFLAGPDGLPYTEELGLTAFEAGRVNIPPTEPGMANVPGTERPAVPVPVRELAPYEALEFGFGGTVRVRDRRVEVMGGNSGGGGGSSSSIVTGGFTQEDREALAAMRESLANIDTQLAWLVKLIRAGNTLPTR